MAEIPNEVECVCGCGQKIPALSTRGKARRFAPGHQNARRWRGGKTSFARGYIGQRERGHSRYRYEHVLIAEQAYGGPLPKGAQVHHVNGDRADNRPSNLVVCQDASYHKLLHRRTAAFLACGNANARRCAYCWLWDDPANLTIGRRSTTMAYHKACAAAYARFSKTFDKGGGQTSFAAWREHHGVNLREKAALTEKRWQAERARRGEA